MRVMGLADVTKSAVVAVMEEYDEIGRVKLCEKYGVMPGRDFFIANGRATYDCKLILSAAHQMAVEAPLDPSELVGAEAALARLFESFGVRLLGRDVAASVELARNFGPVDAVEEEQVFSRRRDLYDAGVHRALQDGIVGTKANGAESIVLSGGYEDDEDHETWILYTGRGGQDKHHRQVADQDFEDSKNAALLTSRFTGYPVRVVRGHIGDYKYIGLFRVVDAWMHTGKRGFLVCRYLLVKIDSSYPDDETISVEDPLVLPEGNQNPSRREVRAQRVVRSTAVADAVKKMYDFTCQICGTRLSVSGRGYAEGAHIVPLGVPHNGPDEIENILCLCPNCHVLFDGGEIVIEDDLNVISPNVVGKLTVRDEHKVDRRALAYHRSAYGS